MTLENLLRIGRLKEHSAHQDELERLLTAARRNLEDARVQQVSPETRFDAAYKAIMQTALVALMTSGFRPNTNQPGHHAIVLQTLPKTVGLPASRMLVLDALRRKRNASDYTGAEIDGGSVETCIHEAWELLKLVENWLAGNQAGHNDADRQPE